ncbi:uncharacterized protein LOC134579382 isoform X2 [Pelobates fuscus]|uniref:uncharacterized protein LOC134579382 isoform X2 n=1 Tax=Pelobates fuscus TaxID=191477 RepID=UPI002FE4CBE5
MDLADSFAMQTFNSECIEQQMEVQGSMLATLSKDHIQMIKAHVSDLVVPMVHQQLYYCGFNQSPARLEEILHTGFSTEDFHLGEYGAGLYFTASPVAARNSLQHYQVLVADVYIGRIEVVHHKQASRTCPTEGCDSLLVPGRTFSGTLPHLQKEFLIFSHLQAIPICILKYAK